MTLEMITRNPLQIPCLTEKYWLTLSGQGPVKLARMLSMVRKRKQPLPRLDGLDRASQLRLEEDNVKRSLNPLFKGGFEARLQVTAHCGFVGVHDS